MTDGIIHPGEQMGSGVQADREQRDVVFVFRDLKCFIRTSFQTHKSTLKSTATSSCI